MMTHDRCTHAPTEFASLREVEIVTPLTCILFGWFFFAQGEPEKPVRYLKPQGSRFVLESELTTTSTPTGSTYISRTVRGSETMTLTIHNDKEGKVLAAEIVHQKDQRRNTASVG